MRRSAASLGRGAGVGERTARSQIEWCTPPPPPGHLPERPFCHSGGVPATRCSSNTGASCRCQRISDRALVWTAAVSRGPQTRWLGEQFADPIQCTCPTCFGDVSAGAHLVHITAVSNNY